MDDVDDEDFFARRLEGMAARSNCEWAVDQNGGAPWQWHDPCKSCQSMFEKKGSATYPGEVAPADWLHEVLNEDWIMDLLQHRDGLRLSYILAWLQDQGAYDEYSLCEQRNLAELIRFGLGAIANYGDRLPWAIRPELRAKVKEYAWHLKGPFEV